VLAAIALGAAAIAAWMIWQRSSVSPSGQIIEVIDGDTVRLNGAVCRLVGFDTPERGDKTTGKVTVIGRRYFVYQAATLVEFAQATNDPKLAAALIERASNRNLTQVC
jgi:hypothetical protein